MAYDKRIVDYCNTNGVDLGIQNVFTPIAEIEKATGFSFINEVNSSTQEICILFNVEFFEYFIKQDYIKNNKIKLVFGYDCVIDKNVVLDLEPNTELIDLTGFSKTKNIEDFKTAMGNRKFDVVFSNPPYGEHTTGALDLKIVQFINANKKIILQPAGWVIGDKTNGKPKTWTNILGKYITQIYFCDFNKLMNIKIKTIGGIIVYNYAKEFPSIIVTNTLSNENYIAKDIYSLTKFGINYDNLVSPFINKIKEKYNDFVVNHIEYKTNTEFPVRFSEWCGNAGKDDFYCPINKSNINNHIINKEYIIPCKENSRYHEMIFNFNTENERMNYLNCWKNKVYRFCLALCKFNLEFMIGQPTRLVPWLDFTRSWTDKDLCKEFNISDELWQYIDKFIPDYYDDYKSGF